MFQEEVDLQELPSIKEGKLDLEKVIYKYRWQITLVLLAIIFISGGVLLAKQDRLTSTKIEVLEEGTEVLGGSTELVVEVAGSVENPGVYKLQNNARVDDALVVAGGLSSDADRIWLEKTINRAAKLADGQKLYIPSANEQLDSVSANVSTGDQTITSGILGSGSNLVNINTASQTKLETLWGIGPVYAQNIIEGRPYSEVEELLTRKIIKTNTYEKNKNLLTVY